jgi:hypothetical protein
MRILTATISIIQPDEGDDENLQVILSDMVEEANRWGASADDGAPFVVKEANQKFETREDPCETGQEMTVATLEDPSDMYYEPRQAAIWRKTVMEMSI